MTSSVERLASDDQQSEASEVVIQVRSHDSLLWSLPVWLTCQLNSIPVRLEQIDLDADAINAEHLHLPPVARVGTVCVSQLMAILETIHEFHPAAGVWPEYPSTRAVIRDACAGVVNICSGSSPFLLDLIDAQLSADATLRCRLNTALDSGYSGRPNTAAAVATVTQLIGVKGIVGPTHRPIIQSLLAGEAARNWFSQPAVRRRRIHVQFAQGASKGVTR